MTESRVGVLGASSLVGQFALPLLRNSGWQVVAFSRQKVESVGGVTWRRLPCPENLERIPLWICLAPIWVLPHYFSLIESSGVRRLVVLSSTSRFTKTDSGDSAEQAVASKLTQGEALLKRWAESRGIEWVVLRPTLIYGLGRDKNISEIARVIRRVGLFPLLGQAQGLRQPIHSGDVAGACISALQAREAKNRAYNISGGETIGYRDMVSRVFLALGRRPQFLTVPLWGFCLAVRVLNCLARRRRWSFAMAERMNRDLVFDHTDAGRDLGFKPRSFVLETEDLPPKASSR